MTDLATPIDPAKNEHAAVRGHLTILGGSSGLRDDAVRSGDSQAQFRVAQGERWDRDWGPRWKLRVAGRTFNVEAAIENRMPVRVSPGLLELGRSR